MILDVVHLVLVLLHKFLVALGEEGERRSVFFFFVVFTVDLRLKEPILHHFELGLEFAVNSLDGQSLLHEACRGGQDCQLFLLDLKRELLANLFQLFFEVDIVASGLLRLVRQQS